MLIPCCSQGVWYWDTTLAGTPKRRKATLVIARLDRLARDVHFVSGSMETKVKFVACDMPEAKTFMLHLYAAVADRRPAQIPSLDALAASSLVQDRRRRRRIFMRG